MGYFPLPELKGKPNRIFVDGKTLNQIAKESLRDELVKEDEKNRDRRG